MAEPYIGEIKLFAFNFAPRGWARCDGQLLPISGHAALFALLGPTYGGDGRTTFALPDLRGRAAMHRGSSHPSLGQRTGVERVSLSSAEMPAHTHAVKANATDDDQTDQPGGHFLCKAAGAVYGDPSTPTSAMYDGSCTSEGQGQPHENMQPHLVVEFCIALTGIFPPRP